MIAPDDCPRGPDEIREPGHARSLQFLAALEILGPVLIMHQSSELICVESRSERARRANTNEKVDLLASADDS
ncbi:MAG TPA: hypothetical protein VFQ35_10045 [Polyangiaceae bacterium]|nr:hypothetical protein [Polyangiaceae bacterium]